MEQKETKTQGNLEGIFEKAYTEYKEYKTYLNSIAKEIEKGRAEFAKYALENKEDIDDILEKMFDINEKPQLQKNDLLKLQIKLLHVYEVVKDEIKVPSEVKEEISLIPRERLSYKIEDGKAIEINKSMNDDIKKYVRENNMAFVKNILKTHGKNF